MQAEGFPVSKSVNEVWSRKEVPGRQDTFILSPVEGFSTAANEKGCHRNVIEGPLAAPISNAVFSTYLSAHLVIYPDRTAGPQLRGCR